MGDSPIATADPITVALVLAPRFPLLSLAICTESLRVANRELGRYRFARRIVCVEESQAVSSSGIPITPDGTLGEIADVPVAIILSSYHPEEAVSAELLAWIRRQDRRGAVLGCVDTGAYLLARAGILGGRHVATHREAMAAYQEMFGDGVVLDQLSAMDGRIASSAGGMATMDMMARIIARCHDDELSARVMHVLNHRSLVDVKTAESAARYGAIARLDRRLARLVELMQANIETPLPIASLSKIARVDPATSRRLFLRHFQQTPGRYYKTLRLERARQLLTNSALRIGQIATMVGFADQATFARSYSQWAGRSPSKSRRAESGYWPPEQAAQTMAAGAGLPGMPERFSSK